MEEGVKQSELERSLLHVAHSGALTVHEILHTAFMQPSANMARLRPALDAIIAASRAIQAAMVQE